MSIRKLQNLLEVTEYSGSVNFASTKAELKI